MKVRSSVWLFVVLLLIVFAVACSSQPALHDGTNAAGTTTTTQGGEIGLDWSEDEAESDTSLTYQSSPNNTDITTPPREITTTQNGGSTGDTRGTTKTTQTVHSENTKVNVDTTTSSNTNTTSTTQASDWFGKDEGYGAPERLP